ncbi:TrbC/VirB2 family protein [Rhodococcus sp. BH5]|uniref:TrbC/VirB2 family protein n=1 Tax=Rhodococcus sp. BH5 TaxID=2871702 RepID=UPI0022CD4BF9|nr:TrbC/VirB2 family protein [Rhodococcus sp. BH5]MCZ9635048.1 TrbC/VirB2 family protein [Rhodococcus sp. BH5]
MSILLWASEITANVPAPSGGAMHSTLASSTELHAQLLGDTPPALPDGDMKAKLETFLGYFKGIAIVAGVFSIVAVGILMMTGMRSRSDLAKTAVTHMPWVIGGLFLAATAAQIVQWVIA